MPNDKSGNYRIEVTIARTKICEFVPTKVSNQANDLHFYQVKGDDFEFD